MPRLSQHSPSAQRSQARILPARILLALVGLAMLSSCVVMPPIFFNAEVASLKAQAARRFPPGSNAAEFEAWFAEKRCKDDPSCKAGDERARRDAHVYFHGDTPASRKFELAKQCKMHSMVLGRIEGCVNQLIANYCVDGAGKLMSLEFKEGGYC